MNRKTLVVLLGFAILACSDSPLKFRDRVHPGQMRVRITGALELEAQWASFGEFDDLLAADTGEFSFLGSQDAGLNMGDSSLTVVFRGRLANGRWDIPGYAAQPPSTAQLAFMILDGPATNDETVWASIPGGWVEIDDADYPPAPGLEPGLMSGRLSFRAVRLVQGPGGMPVESTDSISVTANFAAHWYHNLFPNITLSLQGGPLAGPSHYARAQAVDDDRGGLLVWWDADMDGVPGRGLPFDISHKFRLALPAVGAYSVSSLTPPEFADTYRWPPVYSALYYRGRGDLLGLSAGGALTVTRFVPPTSTRFGEIHGTLNTDLPLWTDSTTAPADTVWANASFAVQLWPLAGVLAAPPLQRTPPFAGWRSLQQR